MDFTQALRDHNLRATSARVSILQALTDANGPLTIEDLQSRLGNQVEQSTLYRSLKKMSDVGLVYQTDFRQGKAYFEYQQHHHHHIVCTDCGVTEDVPLCLQNNIDELTQNSHTFATITSHVLEFFGRCQDCFGRS